MVAFLSWVLLMPASQSPPLALDAHAPIHAPDHVIGQSIQQSGIEVGYAQRGRPRGAGHFRCRLLARDRPSRRPRRRRGRSRARWLVGDFRPRPQLAAIDELGRTNDYLLRRGARRRATNIRECRRTARHLQLATADRCVGIEEARSLVSRRARADTFPDWFYDRGTRAIRGWRNDRGERWYAFLPD